MKIMKSPVGNVLSRFAKVVNNTASRASQLIHMNSISDYMQKWYDGDYTLSIPKSSIVTKFSSVDPFILMLADTDKQNQTVKFELPHRKPSINHFYKGVPIYESLPDDLFRVLIGLPAKSEMSDQLLYGMHTQARDDLEAPNGDVACDSYNKIEEDIELLKDLGVSDMLTNGVLTLY